MLKSLLHPITLACLALGSGYILTGCTASGGIETGVTIPIPFAPDIVIKVTITPEGGKTMTAENLPEGKCLAIQFKGADGAPVGEPNIINVEPGGTASGAVPEGATSWDAEVTDCPKPKKDKAASIVGSGSLTNHGSYHFFGGPVTVSDDLGAHSTTYSIVIDALNHRRAIHKRDVILGANGAVPPDASIDVLDWTTTTNYLTGIEVKSLSDEPFLQWSTTLNGTDTFSFANSMAAPGHLNGWNTATTFVSYLDFNAPNSGTLVRNDIARSTETTTWGALQFSGYAETY